MSILDWICADNIHTQKMLGLDFIPKTLKKCVWNPNPNLFSCFELFNVFSFQIYTILRWTLNEVHFSLKLNEFKNFFFIFKWILFRFFHFIKKLFNFIEKWKICKKFIHFKGKWTNIIFKDFFKDKPVITIKIKFIF